MRILMDSQTEHGNGIRFSLQTRNLLELGIDYNLILRN